MFATRLVPSPANSQQSSCDDTGAVIASSAANDDAVVASAVAGRARHTGPSGMSHAATEFRFDHVTARPLSRETWLTYATEDRACRPAVRSGSSYLCDASDVNSFYSARSALTGSTRLAWRAGRYPATSETAPSTSSATPIATGSRGVTPNNWPAM